MNVQISEETNLLTPSPHSRAIIDVFDEVNCQLDSAGSVLSSTVETSITWVFFEFLNILFYLCFRLLSFGTDKIAVGLNDTKIDVSSFPEEDFNQVLNLW